MRLIGTLPNEQIAQRFADHLLTQGIRIVVEESSNGWTVWVESDDHLEQTRAALDEYAKQVDDPKYRSSEPAAARLREREDEKQRRLRKNYVDVRTNWARPAVGTRPVTFGLIALCIVVFVAASPQIGAVNRDRFNAAINPLRITEIHDGYYNRTLPEIRSGQVWRLVTPALIHFGIWHILFNMWLLYELGSVIEVRRGSLVLGALVLATAIPSNYLQFLWHDPSFGGISGVVYGLFGYVWMKSRFQPEQGMYIHPNTVFMLLAFFAICFTGLMGPVANTAHAAGLAMGVIIGIAPHLFGRLARRR